MKKIIALGLVASVSLAHAQTRPAVANPSIDDKSVSLATPFGSYQKLFSANSLWNSYPVNPVFGTFQIPATTWNPVVAKGAYSSGIFEAKATDAPMVIYPHDNKISVRDPDAETSLPSITIPHWPADTLGATGSDGHADIVDASTGKIYSIYQLKKSATTGKWTASMVAWTPLNGSGWGDPAHYYQGARAAAVPTSGGMIRIAEVDDGKDLYEHALAMSLDYTGLAPAPNHYIFPATSGDTTNPNKANTGLIPEGARMMLPPGFDLSTITDARLLKVARTLMKYGAYVVDRNDNTPFVIYVENGASWASSPASQLNLVRQALRQVVSQSGFINGSGAMRRPEPLVNLMSLRGNWMITQGSGTPAVFDTYTQSVVWSGTTTLMRHANYANGAFGRVKGTAPSAPKRYRLSVTATGGAKLSMTLRVNNVVQLTTPLLGNGQSVDVLWPAGATYYMNAEKPAGGPASLKASFIELPAGQ